MFDIENPPRQLKDIANVRVGEVFLELLKAGANEASIAFEDESGIKIALVFLADEPAFVDYALKSIGERLQIGPTDV